MKLLKTYAVLMLICAASAVVTGCKNDAVKPAKAPAYKGTPVYTGPDSSGNGHPPIPPK